MGRAIQRRSIWCAGLSGLFHSSNHVNETDRKNQMNQIPPSATTWRQTPVSSLDHRIAASGITTHKAERHVGGSPPCSDLEKVLMD
jgi:hypothetical protein